MKLRMGVHIFFLLIWLLSCSPRPSTETPVLSWNPGPDTRIDLATFCCDGPVTEELVRPYIPEAQIWGDGRFLWTEQKDGARQIFVTQLSEAEMTAVLQRIEASNFFGWEEEYGGKPVVDAASRCLVITLTDQNKRVCAAQGGAPGAFYTLFDWLSQGADTDGTLYRPETAYLTGFQLDARTVPPPEPDVPWPERLTHIPIGVAITGFWLDDADALQDLWEATNRSPYRMPVVGDEDGRYRIILQVPGVSWIEPEPAASISDPAPPPTSSRFDCTHVTQIPAAECAALVALYYSTNGPEWVENDGWLVTNTPCSWVGIDCIGDHVSHIGLFFNRLAGPLPPELADLSRLQVIELHGNQLHGPVPAAWGNLSRLVSLEMGGNQLAGSLPAELGDLANLRNLSLAHNQLSGSIPAAWGKLTRLDSLNLSHNQLGGPIPAELGNLANLTQLYLSQNQLSGAIPATFDNLSQLFELDLSYNQLNGIVPESVAQLSQRRLWGNQLTGTITAEGQTPFSVDYGGVHFSVDPSLAASIWPEVVPATPIPESIDGPSFWLAIPEHIRFTLADPDLSPSRRRMGFNLAAEAQILVFPLAELAAITPLVRTQIETLQDLLAEAGTVPAGELPLLPLTNSVQVFHAQAQYLEFGNIQGLRFISQHSQDPHPVLLRQEIFYTFQGISDDGAYYVAAFFPLTTAVLPDTIQVEDWEAFHTNYDTYLLETTAVLDQLSPAEFTPDLILLDAVITSLRVEPDSALFGAESSLP